MSPRRSKTNWNPHIWFEDGQWVVNIASLKKKTNTRWTYKKNQQAWAFVDRLNGVTDDD